jgi:hypothetical protein
VAIVMYFSRKIRSRRDKFSELVAAKDIRWDRRAVAGARTPNFLVAGGRDKFSELCGHKLRRPGSNQSPVVTAWDVDVPEEIFFGGRRWIEPGFAAAPAAPHKDLVCWTCWIHGVLPV